MRRIIACLVLLFALPAFGAAAQSLFSQRTDYASLTLHSGYADGDDRVIGLRMELAEGWKTYWRIPGDSGVPPRFDWSGSENLSNVTTSWHLPQVFRTYGDLTIGYKDRMVVPLRLTPKDPTKPIRVRLNFSYGVCREVCIPAGQDLNLDIPAGAEEDGRYFIDEALRYRLRPATQEQARVVKCGVEGTGDRRVFKAELNISEPFPKPPVMVVEGPEGTWFGRVKTELTPTGLVAVGPVETTENAWINRSDLKLTILGQGRGFVVKSCALS
ncbi:MAG: protein-disulfide reductase DsbD domain-containing protein [Pikeienuella sp.]